KGKVDDALTAGGAPALSAVAFLAVYREGFEVVLFYKALFLSMPGSSASLAGGLIAGIALLALLFLVVVKYSVRLPVREFFLATGALLFVLAVIFAGKGAHELQEAGTIPETTLSGIPAIGDLGFYPSLETLALQVIAVAAFAFLVFRMRRSADPAPEHGRRNI
ncbi:MAG: FTR1 family protein, partial [Candidatus Micrarchaeota archaeon]